VTMAVSPSVARLAGQQLNVCTPRTPGTLSRERLA
jgi:hypothetical protein